MTRALAHRRRTITTPVVADPAEAHAQLGDDLRTLVQEHGVAASTRLAYATDWKHFVAWATAMGFPTLPTDAATVAGYITALAMGTTDDFGPRAAATIGRRLITLAKRHTVAGHADPTKDARVREVWKAARRKLGTAPRQKAPLLRERLDAVVAELPATPEGLRDAALLRFGWAGALRRSELVAIRVEDLVFGAKGVRLRFPRSKTNQEGRLEEIVIPRGDDPATCPVGALERWMRAVSLVEGWVFLGQSKGKHLCSRTLANLVKRVTGGSAEFSGHSLRAGYATQQALDGVPDRAIMRVTRHRSREMLDRYVRDGELRREVGDVPTPPEGEPSR